MATRILFVDDQSMWRMTVGTFLKLGGYSVLTAQNSKEALAHAQGGEVEAVIMDVNLAGEDAAELILRLKTSLPDAPIILYTALEENKEQVQHLLKQGARHYMRKGNLKDLVRWLDERVKSCERKPAAVRLIPAGAWQVL
jgi:CheY-like chemotaxis protein